MEQKQTAAQRKEAAKKRAKAQAEFQKGRPKKYIYKNGKKIEVKEAPETDKSKTFDQSAHRPKGGLGALAKKNKEDKKKRKQFGCGGRAMAKGGGKANKARLAIRSAVTDMLGWEPGMGPPGDPRALAQHEQFSGMLTSKLMGLGIPGAIAGAVVEGLGNINELGSGLTSVTGGGKLFSPEGIDIMDLQANQRGISKAKGSRNAPKMSYPSVPRGKKGGRVYGQAGGRFQTPRPAQINLPQVTAQTAGGQTQFLGSPGVYGQGNGAYQDVTGGLAPWYQNLVEGIQNPDVSGIDNIVGQLTGFSPGGQQQISSLSNFNPFTGQLGTTQGELLASGLPTDVSGATEAAKILAGQEFDAASDKINESLASKGLLSSSARDAAIAREKAKLGERVGAAGLQANIAAQEAAAGRRQAAVSAGLTGTGQQLSGQGTAGQLALNQSGQQLSGLQTGLQGEISAAQLPLQAQTAKASAGAATPSFFRQNPSFTATGGASAPVSGAGAGGGLGAAASVGSRPPTPSLQQPVLHASGGAGGGSGLFGASGGSVPNLKEFERWVDSLGHEMLKAWGPSHATYTDPEQKRMAARNLALGNLGGPEEAFRLFSDPELQTAAKAEGRRHRAAMRGLPQTTHSPGENPSVTDLITGFTGLRGQGKATRLEVSPENSEFWQVTPNQEKSSAQATSSTESSDMTPAQQKQAKLAQLVSAGQGTGDILGITGSHTGKAVTGGDILGVQGSTFNRQFYQEGGPVNPPNTVPMNRPTANLTDLAIAHPTSAGDPRRQFYQEGGPTGGEVPGEDTGQDKVPAMLRSEELVVTPELVQSIESVQTPDQAMAVVEALKALARQPLEYDEESGEHMAAEGGSTSWESILKAIGRIFTPYGEGEAGFPGHAPGAGFYGIPGAPLNTDPVAEAISELTPQGTPASKASALAKLTQQPTPSSELEGPPAPTPMQRVTGQVHDVADLRKPDFMPFMGPGQAPIAQVIQGHGGAPTTLHVTGGEGLGIGEPTRFIGPDGRPLKGTLSQLGTPSLTEDQMQMKRIEDAKRRRDLIQSAMNSDPVGGPEKFARLQNGLNNANDQIKQLVDEVVAKEKNRISERYAAAQGIQAEAALSNSTANKLSAEAQKATAFATVAEKLQAAAAQDPRAAIIIEMFSKMNPKSERGVEQAEAVMKIMLERLGIPLKENGFFRQLFGAPQFELSAPEVAPPDFSAPFGQNITPEIQALLNLGGP